MRVNLIDQKCKKNLEKVILGFVMIVGFQTAFANDAERVCESGYHSTYDNCISIAIGNSFDSDALEICSSGYPSKLNSCLSIIANKTFDTSALSVCGSGYPSKYNECLEASILND